MKLIRAEFENFRLLQDLELDFSTDSTRKLTVIRAANETGKTTILNGLQWAFYGDDALPGKGSDYRLSPIDWDASDRRRISISVQVEFEITNFRYGTPEQYRIIRSAHETLNGIEHNRSRSTVKLFQLTDEGVEPVDPPQARIHEMLPPELREVFFTDGDRALSFIAATETIRAKRERVEKAVRSLLGLEVIEKALNHVGKTASEINKAAKQIGSDKELTAIVTELEQLDAEISNLEKKKDDANSQFNELNQECIDIDKKIKTALIKGNREELTRDIEETKSKLKEIDSQRKEASQSHSQLFGSLVLSRDLLAPVLEKSLGKLNALRDRGRLPTTTIPVLEERLTGTTCICGESLDPYQAEGKHRREHIQCLIDESRKSDALQSMLTELYFKSLSVQPQEVAKSERWRTKYIKVAKRRDELEEARKEQGEKHRALEVQLGAIPDTDVQGLRDIEREYIAQRDRFNADYTKYETQLEDRKKNHRSLVATRNNLLTKQRRGAITLARLEVTRDVESVLQNSYDRITNQELAKVSTLMNNIFLEMIGADPEQGAIIQKAEISKAFDILVYGPNDRPLNPDQDLNGASRRALTLAFILALTKVSGVKAPNIIDTPLGMMSGFVKRSVLKTAIRESSQLILFLTRAEIADCEKILDAEAGKIITLTNPAHYPLMLVNNPQVKELKVLRCQCSNHSEECEVCIRRIDTEADPETIF